MEIPLLILGLTIGFIAGFIAGVKSQGATWTERYLNSLEDDEWRARQDRSTE